jgi:hypothetical protein
MSLAADRLMFLTLTAITSTPEHRKRSGDWRMAEWQRKARRSGGGFREPAGAVPPGFWGDDRRPCGCCVCIGRRFREVHGTGHRDAEGDES